MGVNGARQDDSEKQSDGSWWFEAWAVVMEFLIFSVLALAVFSNVPADKSLTSLFSHQ